MQSRPEAWRIFRAAGLSNRGVEIALAAAFTDEYLAHHLAWLRRQKNQSPGLFINACRSNDAEYDPAHEAAQATRRAEQTSKSAEKLRAIIEPELIEPDDTNLLHAAFPGGWAQVVETGALSPSDITRFDAPMLASKLRRAARDIIAARRLPTRCAEATTA